MANDIIVFITEGEAAEPKLIKNLKKEFAFSRSEILPFKTNIHALYKVLHRDEFYTNIIDVLCERDNEIKTKVEAVGKTNISQVYLFFDYDGHDSQANDDNILEMLEHFNDETDNGKLFISYPMFEAVKDFAAGDDSCYRRCYTDIAIGKKYKEDVSKTTRYQDVAKLSRSDWNRITHFSIKKSACIVTGEYKALEYSDFCKKIEQKNIFENQQNKYIPKHKVAVVSAFPLFLVSFFGQETYEAALDAVMSEKRKV